MKTATEQIRNEITESGAISFARFMALALYCPDCGYYEKEKDTPGHRGDFYTSVSVGSLFGELLAFQFVKWFESLEPQPSTFILVEAGAHDGRLAMDILSWLRRRRPAVLERLEYVILEPSERRRQWQRERLVEFLSHIRWREAPFGDPQSRFTGVVFSNELLDAMPMHRLGWDAKRCEWFEWGVTFRDGRFAWTRLAELSAAVSGRSVMRNWSSELLDVLPDGFTTEICPGAEDWWRQVAGVLERGKLLTIDYGLSEEEFFAPQRANGTLRAYHRHQLSDDVLADPGEQDLTAHVNLTAIERVGALAGLKTEKLESQAQFLTGIARQAWQAGTDFGVWTSDHTRQFQTLTHPDHLGRSFQALVQSPGGA